MPRKPRSSRPKLDLPTDIPRGTGSAYLRTSGSYEIVYRVSPRSQAQYATRDTAEDAIAFLRAIATIRTSGKVDWATATFEEWATTWLEKQKPRGRDLGERNTWERKATVLRTHLVPALGARRMIDFTADDLDRYRSAKIHGELPGHRGSDATPSSDGAIHRQFVILRQIFDAAMNKGLPLASNPADAKVHGIKQGKRKRAAAFRADELVTYQGLIAPEFRALALCQWALGLRMGEVLALRTRDYDPATRVLTIAKGLQRDIDTEARGDGPLWVEGSPKNDSSARPLVVGDRVHEALMTQIDAVQGEDNPRELLFPTKTGMHHNPGNIRCRVSYPAFAELLIKLHARPIDRIEIIERARTCEWLHRGVADGGKNTVSDPQRRSITLALPALVELLVLPGVTIRQLLAVRRDDLDLDGRRITLTAANGVDRLALTLDEVQVRTLRDYLAAVEEWDPTRVGGLLFPGGKKGSQIGREIVYRTLVTSALAQFEGERMTTVHGLRAAYATTSIHLAPELTANALANALGHSNPAITMNSYIRDVRDASNLGRTASIADLVDFGD